MMNDAIKKALVTWYPKDHPLYLDPLHPAIGFAEEAGELLGAYKKEQFKDGVSWWDCVHCGRTKDEYHFQHDYTPKILDELGDLHFYKRILDYISKYSNTDSFNESVDEITILLADLNLFAAQLLHDLIHRRQLDTGRLKLAQERLDKLLDKLDCTLDQLTELNWQKLKDGDHNGWEKAKSSNTY